MSKISVEKPQCGNNLSWFRVLIGVFVVLVVLLVIFAPGPIPQERAYNIICKTNLHYLRAALYLYADEQGNVYPTPEKWCDLLVDKFGDFNDKHFRCPGGEGGRCDYAMNPHVDPFSAPDVVLLFESTSGWNQFGGLEILTLENHNGKGCNILFNDLHVEFVRPEKIEKLRWKDQEGNK